MKTISLNIITFYTKAMILLISILFQRYSVTAYFMKNNSVFHLLDSKGLRLGVFPNRIEADSIKMTHKKLQFNFD
jgi:hypothetical protein